MTADQPSPRTTAIERYDAGFEDIERQCRATSKQSGVQCRKTAIPGGYVCGTHGGKAPQVQEAARRRLQAAAPRAAQVLIDLMDDDGVAASTRARVAADILDRTGHKAVDVSVEVRSEEADSVLGARIAELLAERT